MQDLVIPKAQYFKSMCHQPISTLRIVDLIIQVLAAIKLDNQSFFKADKINDVRAYWYLSLEFKSKSICMEIYPSYLKMRISNFVFCVVEKLPQLPIEPAITRLRSVPTTQNTLL